MAEGMKTVGFFVMFIVIAIFGIVVMNEVGNSSQAVLETSEGNIETSYIATIGSNQSVLGDRREDLIIQSKNDSYMNFDGVNDYVNLTTGMNSLFATNESFSWFAWVRAGDSGVFRNIIANLPQSGDYAGTALALTSDGKLQVDVGQNETANARLQSVTTGYDDGTWHHVGFTYDGSETVGGIELFVDGAGIVESDISDSIDTTTASTSPINIGASGSAQTQFFNGQMDEVRLYSTNLSEATITEIYNSGRYLANSSLPSTDLVAWYSFNAGEGTTLYDKSGNGYNGI